MAFLYCLGFNLKKKSCRIVNIYNQQLNIWRNNWRLHSWRSRTTRRPQLKYEKMCPKKQQHKISYENVGCLLLKVFNLHDQVIIFIQYSTFWAMYQAHDHINLSAIFSFLSMYLVSCSLSAYLKFKIIRSCFIPNH